MQPEQAHADVKNRQKNDGPPFPKIFRDDYPHDYQDDLTHAYANR
jgi:hypothetical protein